MQITPTSPAPPISGTTENLADTISPELLDALQQIVRRELNRTHRLSKVPTTLTVEEVAGHLKVSIRTVEKLITAGTLIPIWVGGQRRFTDEAIKAYLASCTGRRPLSR